MQEAFYEILLEFRARGKTVFLSSHLLSEVEKVCDRVAIIRKGRLVALEGLDALKRRRPRRLLLELDGAAPAGAEAGSPLLPGTRLLARTGPRFEYLIEGDLRAVLQAVAALPVRDVFLPEPDLEDIFMAYYREGAA
jgi:ABC-2 type transport system ATP-binding protein